MEIYSVAQKRPVQVNSIQVIESLDYFSAMLRITTPNPLFGTEFTVPKIEGGRISFVVFMSDFNDNMFVTYMYPKPFFNLYQKIFSGFTGFSTVEKLATSLGFKYDGPKTLSTYWDLPKTSLRKTLTQLTRFASVDGGGAPHFYVNLYNNFQCVDYKYSIEKMKPAIIQAVTTRTRYSTEWWTQIPGDFQFVKFFPDGTEIENYTVRKGSLYAQVSCYLATRDATNILNQAYSNQYYEYYYTTNQVNVSLQYAGGFGLGQSVTLTDNDTPMVVRARTTTMSTEDTNTQTLELVSPM